jgi:hypothetical protein
VEGGSSTRSSPLLQDLFGLGGEFFIGIGAVAALGLVVALALFAFRAARSPSTHRSPAMVHPMPVASASVPMDYSAPAAVPVASRGAGAGWDASEQPHGSVEVDVEYC